MPFETMTMADGAAIEVYRAHSTGARRVGIVLVQEIFGVTEHIQELCDEYADDGYEVLAPALFDREHPGFRAGYNDEQFGRAVQLARELHPFDQSIADVRSCVEALREAGPVFVTGYCYGGSVAFVVACRIDGIAAASGYYGGVIKNFAGETPRCPTILHFGRFDASIPMEDVDAVAAARPDVEVYVYEAGHGFNSDRRKDYHEPSAELARQRTLDLFRANGG